MPGGAVAGRADIIGLFDQNGDPTRPAERVVKGTFNAARRAPLPASSRKLSAAVMGTLREADHVCPSCGPPGSGTRNNIAGYVYGRPQRFVYFGNNPGMRSRDLTGPANQRRSPPQACPQHPCNGICTGVDVRLYGRGCYLRPTGVTLHSSGIQETVLALRWEEIIDL